MTLEEIKALQSNIHATFDTPQGKETMRFIEKIGKWTPTMFDSGETNEIIARDANRRLIGTIKSMLELSAEQVMTYINKEA